jgi:hypothetical protein
MIVTEDPPESAEPGGVGFYNPLYLNAGKKCRIPDSFRILVWNGINLLRQTRRNFLITIEPGITRVKRQNTQWMKRLTRVFSLRICYW